MITNPALAPLITELVEIYFESGLNQRRDDVGRLGLSVINSKASDPALCNEFAAAARTAAREVAATLTRAADLADALARMQQKNQTCARH
ncbi:hypothetical protein ACL02S_23420 [Nocardia sp. 004]|uniref:hypothetical protein n=1 Tax=Nocardia sp. 004 TaxID=3385978 RepID=UPI00399FA3AF